MPAAAIGVAACTAAAAAEQPCLEGRLRLGSALNYPVGRAVALDNDLAVVGRLNTEALIYRRQSGVWVHEATISGSDTSLGDLFGEAVAISGTTLVVGAPLDNNAAGGDAGAAYIMELQRGEWVEVQKLEPPTTQPNQQFGGSVAIRGDHAIIGAYAGQGGFAVAPRVYAYQRRGGQWQLIQELTPTTSQPFTDFGAALALGGPRLAVGAPRHDNSRGVDAGIVYIFDFDAGSGQWVETAAILPVDGAASDAFGRSVALDGGVLVAGSPSDSPAGPQSGSARVFELLPHGVWLQRATLVSPIGGIGRDFGLVVAVEDNLVLVGEPDGPSNATSLGAAHLFRRTGNIWPLEAVLMPPIVHPGSLFGQSVAVHAGDMLVGAPGGGGPLNAPSAFVYAVSAPGTRPVDCAPAFACISDENCCLPSDSPGCDDGACCQSICQIDTYCCTTAWDTLCAAEAIELCDLSGCPPNSCLGDCGGQSGDGCYCDEACVTFNDCCPDVCDACDDDLTICADGSCFGFCGGRSPQGCFCDEPCCTFGDCCDDMCWDCFYPICCANANGSCEGACGGASSSGCFCDVSCCTFSDCCPDVDVVCGTCAPSCKDNCGLTSHGFTCGCDGACFAFGDCCADICTTCPDFKGCTNSCAGRCGTVSPVGCYCDSFCVQFGDCCPDLCAMCPSTPGCAENPCPADLTGDGQVNGLDLGHMLLLWQSANPIADIAPAPGGDGVVGGADLGALLLAWGDCR